MLQIVLKENSTSISDLFGVSEERKNELAEKMVTIFAEELKVGKVEDIGQLMTKVINGVSPENIGEFAVIMWPMESTMQKFEELISSPFGELVTLLNKMKGKKDNKAE